MLDIHLDIRSKLDFFIKVKKIPNIIFHGPSGGGKRTILTDFINNIYQSNKEIMRSHVLFVDCAHGRGIKFIREDLKFFAKTNIHNADSGARFKSIILLNADKLTVDAQSALRRCIELFSHSTRFFIVVENKYKLLKPILSRFCEIYISHPIYNGEEVNLHKYNISETFNFNKFETSRSEYLKNQFSKLTKQVNYTEIIKCVEKLYNKSYSGLDIINFIDNNSKLENRFKYSLLTTLHKIRREFRNEKLLMLLILNFVYVRSDYNLENIAFM